MGVGNYPAALTELSEAIRMKPDFATAYNARGYLNLDQKISGRH